jgi:hypothetical protein
MQTTYNTNLVEGTAGLIAEAGGAPRIINSISTPTDNIPFGRAVESSDGTTVRLPTGATFGGGGSTFYGVAIRDTSIEGAEFVAPTIVGAMSLGRIWVETEEQVEVGDPVFYRTAGKKQIQTFTLSADIVTGNTVAVTINGVPYTQAFSSDHLTSITALAAQLVTNPDILTAVVGGGSNRVITITSDDDSVDVDITGEAITGGASQATITVAETQASVAGADRGKFRTDDDSSTATVTYQARWIQGNSGAGLAIVEISLP